MTNINIHPAIIEVDKLLLDCAIGRIRRSGPGGQHRNKTESAVHIVHTPSGVNAEANERRSQHVNKKIAIFRLRVKLALAVRTTVSNQYPSKLWLSRVRKEKLAINPQHLDFPSILAEALDVVVCFNYDVKAAAEHQHISTSQLIKFLAKEPKGLQLVNDYRTKQGLYKLK